MSKEMCCLTQRSLFFCGIAILSTAQGFMDPKVGEFFLVCSKKF